MRTWSDLIERAAIAVRWNAGQVDDPAYPDDAIASDPSVDVRALPFVVRSILNLAGKGALSRPIGEDRTQRVASRDGGSNLPPQLAGPSVTRRANAQGFPGWRGRPRQGV